MATHQQNELGYDYYDPNTNTFYPRSQWPIALPSLDTDIVDAYRNASSVEQIAPSMRATTMNDAQLINEWQLQHYQMQQLQQQQHQQQQTQQMLQRQQQQQEQQYQLQPQHIYHQQIQQLAQDISPVSYIGLPQHELQHIPLQQNSLPQHSADFLQHVHQHDPIYTSVFDAITLPNQMIAMPGSQASIPVSLPLNPPYPSMSHLQEQMYSLGALNAELVGCQTTDAGPVDPSPYAIQLSSPTLSQPSSADESYYIVNNTSTRVGSFESSERSGSFCIKPRDTVHRSLSESPFSEINEATAGFLSNLDMGPSQSIHSPTTFSDSDYEVFHTHASLAHEQATARSNALIRPIPIPQSQKSTPGSSPGSLHSSDSSPRGRLGKKSAIVLKGNEKVSKRNSQDGKKEEKRVGKRKGPLRPEQRKQASEIRKLRACLRCKFLKKTCDKGEPCAGCQPSHARLWQVPCTRIDIKEIGYFLKDKKFDYERHVSLAFSISNIKGFSDIEKTVYVTHGYGQMLPVMAREVYVRDDACLKMDWSEALIGPMSSHEVPTAKMSAGVDGISTTLLSDYLDRHIDGTGIFEKFVDDYFAGTKFLSEMLKTAYHFYARTSSKIIKKALKLMLAYNLTLHITMLEGISEEEGLTGKIDEPTSKFHGKFMAPVMINFQIKCAMADMWRELHKEVLEELSSLYSSVYTGDKLKNWPTIFMLASILLAVWECMQFDCHYRVPDEAVVDKFCTDMEATPVGVIVGLFAAISQKLPSILEWDTTKHHALLNSDWGVCSTMTEVREHVISYEHYLRERPSAKFDRNNFDSLTNKFLSRLVLRDMRVN